MARRDSTSKPVRDDSNRLRGPEISLMISRPQGNGVTVRVPRSMLWRFSTRAKRAIEMGHNAINLSGQLDVFAVRHLISWMQESCYLPLSELPQLGYSDDIGFTETLKVHQVALTLQVPSPMNALPAEIVSYMYHEPLWANDIQFIWETWGAYNQQVYIVDKMIRFTAWHIVHSKDYGTDEEAILTYVSGQPALAERFYRDLEMHKERQKAHQKMLEEKAERQKLQEQRRKESEKKDQWRQRRQQQWEGVQNRVKEARQGLTTLTDRDVDALLGRAA